jgi:PAS domain S-box-containing protein
LEAGGYKPTSTVVDSPAAMRSALERQEWDVITSDHAMPHFSAPAALALAKELRPDVPFIIVSGEIDLNLAVSLMKEGAWDYIQKRELPRLIPAIKRALGETALRRLAGEAKSALETSETRYRRLFETAQDGILILDADSGEIQDVNPFLMEMLGFSKEEFVGKRLWEIVAFRDKEASQAAYRKLQSNGYVRYENLPLQTRDGRPVDVEFISNIYSVDHARVAQCNIRNITDRTNAEAEIRKLHAEVEQRVRDRTAQLEAINKELETFNYAVSHDLRAPLRHIMGFASKLKEAETDEERADSQHLIGKIRVAAQNMNSLIEALLELARFSAKALSRQSIDVSSVVHEIAEGLRKTDPSRQVDLVIADGVTAHADDPLLRIVLENLLGNAWKFTSGRVPAHIEFGTAKQADGSLAYFVRDDGAGFDMAYAQKLYGPFQRLHSEKEFPGIGIGLATVQRIIHRHGGRVWAEAAVDKGATIYFTLVEP